MNLKRLDNLTGNGKGHPRIHLELSRKNLLALLSKLDMPDSSRTILLNDPKAMIIVTAVPDEVAYKDRPAGVMHPFSESWIKEHAK